MTISVRGDATRLVDPDFVTCRLSINAVAEAVDDASARVERTRERLVTALDELGGTVATPTNAAAPLTWSVSSLHTGYDGSDKRARRYAVSVSAAITLRDFGLLPRLTKVLTGNDHISVYSVSWQVDDNNPAWREVRADAIHAAIRKGADYASALGGSVTSIEHVADSGLLGGAADRPQYQASALRASASGIEHGDAPSLDPVPQEVSAVIEARLRATTAVLDAEDEP